MRYVTTMVAGPAAATVAVAAATVAVAAAAMAAMAAMATMAACGPVAPPAGPPANAPTGSGHEVWVYRELETGPAQATSRADTYRLERNGLEAQLTVVAEVSDEGGADARHLAVWRELGTRTFAGRATEGDDRLLLELHEVGGEVTWHWRCGLHTFEVAPADAARAAREDAPPSGCADEGVWTEPARPVDTFTCRDRDLGADELDGAFPFAREPGIERLAISGDCEQGSGLRFIPAGGAIAPVRATRVAGR